MLCRSWLRLVWHGILGDGWPVRKKEEKFPAFVDTWDYTFCNSYQWVLCSWFVVPHEFHMSSTCSTGLLWKSFDENGLQANCLMTVEVSQQRHRHQTAAPSSTQQEGLAAGETERFCSLWRPNSKQSKPSKCQEIWRWDKEPASDLLQIENRMPFWSPSLWMFEKSQPRMHQSAVHSEASPMVLLKETWLQMTHQCISAELWLKEFLPSLANY